MVVFGKERDYIIHDLNNIKGFFSKYRWLSNYHVCPVYFDGILFSSSEAAYMSAKTDNVEIKKTFASLSPSDAKKKSYELVPKEGWTEIKYDVMSAVLFDKFYRNQDIRKLLLDTGDKYLEETNHWSDFYWGRCNGKGENNLGKILMGIRQFWKTKQINSSLVGL